MDTSAFRVGMGTEEERRLERTAPTPKASFLPELTDSLSLVESALDGVAMSGASIRVVRTVCWVRTFRVRSTVLGTAGPRTKLAQPARGLNLPPTVKMAAFQEPGSYSQVVRDMDWGSCESQWILALSGQCLQVFMCTE
jgi:hypothetical protein